MIATAEAPKIYLFAVDYYQLYLDIWCQSPSPEAADHCRMRGKRSCGLRDIGGWTERERSRELLLLLLLLLLLIQLVAVFGAYRGQPRQTRSRSNTVDLCRMSQYFTAGIIAVHAEERRTTMQRKRIPHRNHWRCNRQGQGQEQEQEQEQG